MTSSTENGCIDNPTGIKVDELKQVIDYLDKPATNNVTDQ